MSGIATLLIGLAAAPTTPPPPIDVVAPKAAAQLCPPFGAAPTGCIKRPLESFIVIYTREGDAEPADRSMVRAPWNQTRYDAVPIKEFPSALMQGDEEGYTTVALRLMVAPDNSVAECQVVSLNDWSKANGSRKDLPDNQGIGAAACRLARQYGKFLHGVDRSGKAVGGPLSIAVHFDRHRFAAPAPPPPVPSRNWIGNGMWSTDSWPPRYVPYTQPKFAEPHWGDFLTDKKKLPDAATVGVSMTFDKAGAVTDCTVRAGSGDPRLDAASCAALRSVKSEQVTNWPITDFPVLIQWRGNKAEMVPLRQPLRPILLQPFLMAASDMPKADLPQFYRAEIQVQSDAAGKALSCTVVRTTGEDAFDARSCQIALERIRFSGGKDIFGRPAVGGMRLDVDWKDLVITGPATR